MANQTAWTKVVEKVELEDTGDILRPLKKLHARYIAEAKIREQAALEAGAPKLAAYYRQAAVNIGRLVGQ